MSPLQWVRRARRRAVSPLVAATLLTMAPAAAAQPRQPSAQAPKLTRPPKLVTFVEAEYPPSERAGGKTANVVLQIAILADGTVGDAIVTQSAGTAFDAAAMAAAKKFIFEPALVDDKPAAIKILYRYEFVLRQEAPKTGRLAGVVRVRKTKKPLADVTVELDTGEHFVTDVTGHFHFDDVAPGKHTLSLSGKTLTLLRTDETIEAGKQLDATYDVDEKDVAAPPGADNDDLEILIVAPPLQKQVLSTQVSAEQGRKVPGTQGDVLKVVENLPGVARAAAGSGQLVVWGASPEDTRVYVDGVRVPRLYHDGGFRSVVHSDLVQSVELSPGGYGSAYGRGLGGIVTIQLRPLEADGFHGSVAADVLDAAAAARVSIGDKLRVAVAFRKSYLDELLPLVTSRDVTTLFPIPRYSDGQARLVYAVAPGATIEVGGMFSSDATDRVADAGDPALRKTESTTLDWTRVYARYREEHEGLVSVVTPWFGTESSSLVSRFGATPTELSVHSKVFGVRASRRVRPEKWLTMTLGVDAEATSSSLHRAGSVTSPPREGDIRVFGQAPSNQVNSDDWNVLVASVAPYVEGDISLFGGKSHIIPGVRFDPYVISGDKRLPVFGDNPNVGYFTSEALVEPRLAWVTEVTPRLRAKVAYGRYHQTPNPQDLSSVFGNPSLESARADHYLASALVRLSTAASLEATGFYTTSTGLAARSQSPSPSLAEALEPAGSGRSYGLQLLLRQELSSRFFGWVSYTLSRAERQDVDGGPWRLFDFDQTHVLTALASYAIGAGFEIGARVRYATGFPRTAVKSAYFDAQSGLYEPVFGPQNAIRIPAFLALDVRLSKRFAIGKTELEAYLDVQNVTNRQNPEEIVYTHDYSQQSTINGFPILPSLGLRYSW